MQPATITRILQVYGISAGKVDAPQGGYRNKVHTTHYSINGQAADANLIIFKRELGVAERIRRANRLGDHLATAGLPARRTIDPRIMQLKSTGDVQYAGLYSNLPGQTIAWEGYSMNHLKCLGLTMAAMHLAAKNLPRLDEPATVELHTSQLQTMQNYFNDEGVKNALHVKLGLIVPANTHAQLNSPPQPSGNPQVLHMDFVRGNVLFQEPTSDQLRIGSVQVSGIIDFEKTAWGNTIYDIARTMAFLLVDCKYKTSAQVYKYFLRSGYIKHGGGTVPDPIALNQLILYFLMYDFYKFLKHSPYESLTDNEHFVRTKQLLLQNNLLEQI